jgi:hypothetical protein
MHNEHMGQAVRGIQFRNARNMGATKQPEFFNKCLLECRMSDTDLPF